MAIQGAHVFDHSLQTANLWLKAVERELHIENPNEAHQAMRVVLHLLRDRLPAAEATHLGSQLPQLISGLYYEGFKLREKPIKYDAAGFLHEIRERLRPGLQNPDPERYLSAVLRVLSAHVSPGELDNVRSALPKDLQRLWNRLLKAGAEEVLVAEEEVRSRR
jgi:uncharacterized protein (DUF2267 family)